MMRWAAVLVALAARAGGDVVLETLSVEANGETLELRYGTAWTNLTAVVGDFVSRHSVDIGGGCSDRKCVADMLRAALRPPPPLPKKTLVVYAYSEHTRDALDNARFFLRFGVFPSEDHDFIFVANGCHSLDLPAGVEVIERENTCFDFGAWGAALRHVREQRRSYEYVVVINASVRGPFLPAYERRRWPDVFTDGLEYGVGLVGTSLNCFEYGSGRGPGQEPSEANVHLQSMTRLTLTRQALAMRYSSTLEGGFAAPFFQGCASDKAGAIYGGELALSRAALTSGLALRTQLAAFGGIGGLVRDGGDAGGLALACESVRRRSLLGLGDVYFPTAGEQPDVSPLEAVFFKTARSHAGRQELERLTRWTYVALFGHEHDARKRDDLLAPRRGRGCDATPPLAAVEDGAGGPDSDFQLRDLAQTLAAANERVSSLAAEIAELQKACVIFG
ncbi:hypothetical protein M885DRAFT_611667 [Pelagophyceae sp. CCMP2097]|nr:hypothetical protein M885DRAFT_611667 [Pelagophyceae sp. CCMP2097]